MIHRLRGPVILLLAGVIALLDRMNIINGFWHWFVPLLLILLGVFLLAERVVLAAGGGYPAAPYPGAVYPSASTGYGPYPGQPEAYVPPIPQPEANKDFEGGER
jgi:hypothetical protein